MTGLRPPYIRHVGYKRTDNMPAIATEAAAAIHMGKGERALLLYYAAHSSGFRPALQAIANATGMNRSQVWRNRNALEAHGLILVEDDRITIDWRRAKLYATLDPRLTSKHCFFAPQKKRRTRRVSLYELRYSPLNTLLPKLARLTEEEYAALRRRVKENYNVFPKWFSRDKRSPDLRRAV